MCSSSCYIIYFDQPLIIEPLNKNDFSDNTVPRYSLQEQPADAKKKAENTAPIEGHWRRPAIWSPLFFLVFLTCKNLVTWWTCESLDLCTVSLLSFFFLITKISESAYTHSELISRDFVFKLPVSCPCFSQFCTCFGIWFKTLSSDLISLSLSLIHVAKQWRTRGFWTSFAMQSRLSRLRDWRPDSVLGWWRERLILITMMSLSSVLRLDLSLIHRLNLSCGCGHYNSRMKQVIVSFFFVFLILFWRNWCVEHFVKIKLINWTQQVILILTLEKGGRLGFVNVHFRSFLLTLDTNLMQLDTFC